MATPGAALNYLQTGIRAFAVADSVVLRAAPLARSAVPFAGVAERAVPQVAANRLAGDAFRDEIAGLLKAEGRDVGTEVYKSTPFGKRFIDIEVSKDGQVLGGIETKFGGSRYTPVQQTKDWWLKANEGYIVNVVRSK